MYTYIIRRILAFIPMFLCVSFTYFAIYNFAPGGPVQERLQAIKMGEGRGGKNGDVQQTEKLRELEENLKKQYNLDKPVPVRYFMWLRGLLRFDFGNSTVSYRPVMEEISKRVPIALFFGVPLFVLTYGISVPLGAYLALNDGKRRDSIIMDALFVWFSIPITVAATALLLVFCTSRVFGHAFFPLGGFQSDNASQLPAWGLFLDHLDHMWMPMLAYMTGSFTTTTLMTKNSLLDVLRQDYIRTARAKGLTRNSIIFKHALRNALLPIVVGFGGFIGLFLSGSFIIEDIFNIPGFGTLGLKSLGSRDYPVLMAIFTLGTMAGMFGNLLSDLLYAAVDPRISYE